MTTIKTMTTLLAAVALLVLQGCATNYASAPPEKVAAAMKVTASEFDAAATYVGPPVSSTTQRGLFTDNETVRLYAKAPTDGGELSYFVWVQMLYSGGWRYYEGASYVGGAQANVTVQDRQVFGCTGVGCTYTETIYFPIDYSMISGGGDLRFRVDSKKGVNNVLTIPASYKQGFIMGLQGNIQ